MLLPLIFAVVTVLLMCTILQTIQLIIEHDHSKQLRKSLGIKETPRTQIVEEEP